MGVRRILTAAALLPLLVLYILKLPAVYYAGLLAVASAVALSEFYGMYRVREPLKYAGIALGMLVIAGVHITGETTGVLAVSFIAVAALRLFSRKTPSSSLADIAPVVLGLLYIPALLGYQIFIIKAAPELLVFLLGAVWGADAMALYVGKGIGGRKLYETMSPNKTIAGGVGSLLGGTLGAVLVRATLIPDMPLNTALLTGGIIGAVAVVGDLVESMFKRDAGVKDSGSFLPGHGGMLDKIDGSVFAGPVLFWMLSAMKIIQ
jgi:phosphatidate cytidylyltransferase